MKPNNALQNKGFSLTSDTSIQFYSLNVPLNQETFQIFKVLENDVTQFLGEFNDAVDNDKNGGEIKLLKDLRSLKNMSESLECIIAKYDVICKFTPLEWFLVEDSTVKRK